jgi:dTDP-4-amino-4,6-dideoxygalactose transaminase
LIPITRPLLPPLEDYVELLEQIWQTRMLSNFAEFSQQFENEASAYLGARNTLAVASCDLGLMLALRALELPPGAPCFVSDFTFNSTVNAAIWAGLEPVLVDIDPDTYNMSPEALKAEMREVPDSGVVLATHVFGNPCDVDSLTETAVAHGSFLVFDAAHAYGSIRNGERVGKSGDAEVFSFSGTKVVTSGEGGLVTTRHDWLAERVQYMRAYGFQHDYMSRYVGLNAKISELNAALGVLSIRGIDRLLEMRSAIVDQYRSGLGGLVSWQKVSESDTSTYKDLALGFGASRSAVEEALAGVDVQTKRYFVPLHTMKPYAGFNHGDKPASSALHDTTLCVPLYADLDQKDLELIISTIRQTLT